MLPIEYKVQDGETWGRLVGLLTTPVPSLLGPPAHTWRLLILPFAHPASCLSGENRTGLNEQPLIASSRGVLPSGLTQPLSITRAHSPLPLPGAQHCPSRPPVAVAAAGGTKPSSSEVRNVEFHPFHPRTRVGLPHHLTLFPPFLADSPPAHARRGARWEL